MTRSHNESGPRLAPVGKPSPPGNNEAELERIRGVSLQHRAAPHELYLLSHRRLPRLRPRLTQRHDLGEEVINDTLLAVWNSAERFRGDSRVSTWIVGIAYRRALKSMRRRSFEIVGLEETEIPAGVDSTQACENQQWIEGGLEELPIEQRLCLELAYVLGHSCEEIAVITSCSVNTVKTRLFHARRKLSALLPRLAGASDGR